jgi:hypothetical protein
MPELANSVPLGVDEAGKSSGVGAAAPLFEWAGVLCAPSEQSGLFR